MFLIESRTRKTLSIVKDFQNLLDTSSLPPYFSFAAFTSFAAFMVERKPGKRGHFPRQLSCQSSSLENSQVPLAVGEIQTSTVQQKILC